MLSLKLIHSEPVTIDTIYYYKQGVCETEFRNNPNFPFNVFGIPSRNATLTIPASSLEEIEAIGIGGEIIVGFKDRVLMNGPGVDFVIFENAFVNPVGNGIFAEPGIVSVSQNGIDYYEFPFNPASFEGLSGTAPTNGDNDPFNPEVSGGNKFDLDDVGLDHIKYIRIKDTTLLVKSLPQGHKFKNPDFLLTGFDLDAVVGIYPEMAFIVSVFAEKNIPSYSLVNDLFEIQSIDENEIELRIYNLVGDVTYSKKAFRHTVDISSYPNGLYIGESVMGRIRSHFKFVK